MTKEQIKQIIRTIATEYGVNPDKAIQVAINESSLNPLAKNRNNDRRKTLDRGLYQLNDFWYAHISDKVAYDPEGSTRVFCKAVRAGRAIDWYGACGVMWVWDKAKKNKILI